MGLNRNDELLIGRDCIVCGCFISRTGKGYALYCPGCLKKIKGEYVIKSIQNFRDRHPHYYRDFYRLKRRGFDGEVVAVTCTLCDDLVLTHRVSRLYCESCRNRVNIALPHDYNFRDDRKILLRLKKHRGNLLIERYGEYREWVKPSLTSF